MEQKAVVGKLENLSNHILEECEKRGLSICEMQMLGNFISNKISNQLHAQFQKTNFQKML